MSSPPTSFKGKCKTDRNGKRNEETPEEREARLAKRKLKRKGKTNPVDHHHNQTIEDYWKSACKSLLNAIQSGVSGGSIRQLYNHQSITTVIN